MKKNLLDHGYVNHRECIILSYNEDGVMDDVFYIDMWWWFPLLLSLTFMIGVSLFALLFLISPILLILWVPLVILLVAALDQLT